MAIKKFLEKQIKHFFNETLPKLEKQAVARQNNIEKEYFRLKDAPVDKLQKEYSNRLTPPERKRAIEAIMRERR